VVLHFASLDVGATIVFALDFEFDAIISYVLVHIVEGEHQSTFEYAINNSERTLTQFVIINIFS